MADEIKLLEVDVAGLAKSIQNAKVELDSLRIALDATTEAEGKNSEATTIAKAAYDAQNKSVKQLEGALLRVTQAEQALGANIQDIVKNYDASNKSIDQNRKVLNALTAEYNKLGKEGREKLAPSIKQISDELKKQEGAIGDTRRNVGNYKEAITSAFGELKGFGGQLVSVGQNIGGAVNAFKAAEGGVKGFGAALATTGLPLIIMGVNALTEAFSSFKPVADAVENTLTALSAGFRALITGGNIGEAVKSSTELLEVMRDLEDTQDAYNLNLEKSRNLIAALIIQSKDRTKNEKERTELLEQAEKLEKENYDKSVKRNADLLVKQQAALKQKLGISDAELKILAETDNADDKRYSNLRSRLEKTKGLTDEELKKYQNTLLEKIKLDGEYNVFLERIVNSRNKLIEKQEADAEKRKEEAKKREKEILDDFVKQAQEKEKALKELRDNRLAQEELASLTGKSMQKIDADYEAALLNDRFLTFKDFVQKQKEEYNKGKQEEVKATEEAEKAKQDAQKETVDKAKQNTSLLTDDVKKQVNDVGAIISGVVGLIGSIGDNLMQQSEQNIQALEAQKEAGLITQNEFDKRAKQEKEKAFKEAKALNIVMAIMNTANAVIAQLSNPTPYVGIALAALAAATGAAQIAIIAKQQPPKFAEGGSVFDVGGKPHSSGGTKYVGEDGNRFEVERGEKIFVMKATASKYIDALGGVNMMFGGRSWGNSSVRFAAQGGAIQDGGFVARNTTQRADELATQKALISTLLKNMPAPVVSVQEINKVNNGRNKSVAVSEL